MAINKFSAQNFKGFGDKRTFEIAPLTVLIGPNSSGKSSFIHALATLGQTASIPNASSPLILDHDFSDVHLGRFIDVIHTKKYTDEIRFELTLPGIMISVPATGGKTPSTRYTSDIDVTLVYKSTLRTQEVYISCFEVRSSQHTYSAVYSQKKGVFNLTGANGTAVLKSIGAFQFYPISFGGQLTPADIFVLQMIMNSVAMNLKSIRYLGPFRQSPQRFYANKNSNPEKVGPEGEYAISMLASEVISTQKRTHQQAISKWLSALGIGKSIALKRQGTSDQFTVDIGLGDSTSFPVPDLGYGISQIIPVLAQCSFAPAGSLLLFEQPEIHLHASSARKLGSIFVESIAAKQLSIVCETHSKELMYGILREIQDGRITSDQVRIYKISRNNQQTDATRIEIDDEGEIYANWDAGL